MRLSLVVQTTSAEGSGRYEVVSVDSSNQSVERAFLVRKGVVRCLSFVAHARSLLPRSGARTKLYSEGRSPSSSETRAAVARPSNFRAERQGTRAAASNNERGRPRRYRDSEIKPGNASCSRVPSRCYVGNSSAERTTSSLATLSLRKSAARALPGAGAGHFHHE